MIPVAADHAAYVINRYLFPGLVPDVLPARNFLEHQKANLVTGIQEMPRLRIVGGSNDIALKLVAEYLRITALNPRRHRLSYEGEGLMTIQATQFDDFAIQLEAMIGELRLAKTNGARNLIEQL